ncbi:MAG: NMD3-related protein [Nanoarchaeota archaeon]
MGIKSKFCPRCGSNVNFVEGLCANCKFKQHEPKLPEKVVVRVCRDCKAVNWKGLWVKTDESPEYYLTMALEQSAILPQSAIIKKLEITKMGRKGKVDVILDIDGRKFEETMSSDIYIKDSRCQDCGNMISEDHKGIIQVRSKKDATKILDFTKDYKTTIIKIEDQKNGFDIYLVSKESTKQLSNDLRKRFKFSYIGTSHRQYSWDKSRNRPRTRINMLMKQDD